MSDNERINILSKLESEQKLLFKKMQKVMEKDDFEAYKHLVLILKEITYLIQTEEDKLKCKDMYIDVGRDVSYIYFNGNICSVKQSYVTDFIILSKIKELTNNNKNVKIFIDTRFIGTPLFDVLASEGFVNIQGTSVDRVNPNRM